ncbi:MAG: branched-chain amino acid ABC transporter substrate-binding protein [Rhodospirillales bacterium]|jgi:branched-chain amino acid transport system substrate-binding protein|nr:branched-chain amino acid ABC transporter substrate-binding protein [Rhodospirillales bacterium]
MITRRAAAQLLAGTAAAAAVGIAPAFAADKTIVIGVHLPLTGADAQGATRILHGAQLALDQANASNAVPGYIFKAKVFDNATATAGQYDPSQAATNARRMVSDPNLVAAIGPEMSGDGKAEAPIFSQGDLATITPASTNADITSPKFAAEFMPGGKAIYFRTVTTDAYQGPEMTMFFAKKLNVKTVYILDDSGAYGVGLADAFEAQAKKIGMKVVGRDRLDPKNADYTTILTKIKSMNPQALYYGGVDQAGVKLVKQSYQIIPKMIKGGGDGMVAPEILTAAGFPAANGWYATIAAPHLVGDPKSQGVIREYTAKFGAGPDDYALTAYDAGLIIVGAVKTLVAEKKPITKANMRDAIQKSKTPTLQGVVEFDKYGDMKSHTVSVYQIREDKSKPLDNMIDQYHYLGAAPQV